ncbi:MAG: FMN-binding glutamate synthase family protein [Gammaproteobacteria bacterium]|nr:FMN-binding glutamate synthase family protein [Gammaproteobacteria bacterium]
MSRGVFALISLIILAVIGYLASFWLHALYLLIPFLPLIILGFCDMRSTHNVLRNYPVVGHLRYMLEFIRPEIQQYFVQTDLSGRPFSREMRSLVYRRAKNLDDTHPFGTEHDITKSGYVFANHSIAVKKVKKECGRVTVGGPDCKKPYSASIINVSAMSFGALSQTAVMALNLGAKKGNFYQNTGEGGLTKYHLKHGGDITWQIGTGYFGCRTPEGGFDAEKFKEKANLDAVKMIEIKISQGAKPSHGGVLPGDKVNAEISEIRGVPIGVDCLSPPDHQTFSDPTGLMHYIKQLREYTGGKPIGFKLVIGIKSQFMAMCKAMLETGILPDFITVDGAEGGTGAAPLVFSNRLGMPSDESVAFVHNCLVGCGVRDKIRVISSAKTVTSFDVLRRFALGADMINMARPFLFSIGCIQAIRCNTNTCPTGVTTNKPKRFKAIVPDEKSEHVKNFHDRTIESVLELSGAMGLEHPCDVTPDKIFIRTDEVKSRSISDEYAFVESGNFLSDNIHDYYKKDWAAASAKSF